MDMGISSKLTVGSKVAAEAEVKTIGKVSAETSAEREYAAHLNRQESKSTEEAFTMDISQLSGSESNMQRTTTCTPMIYNDAGILMSGSDAPLGAGFWQWVIATEDLQVTAMTNHTVCRTGVNAFKPPTCS